MGTARSGLRPVLNALNLESKMKTTVLSGVIRIYVPIPVLDAEDLGGVIEDLARAAYGLTTREARGYYANAAQFIEDDILIFEMWVNQQNEPHVEALVLSLVEKLLAEGEQEVLVTRNEVATLYRL